jgi:hypothetical protein
MDHIEVLMRLVEAEGAPLTGDDVVSLTRLGVRTVGFALDDLVAAELVAAESPAGPYRFAPQGMEDRAAIAALAALYHQRPVSLVKLVYEQASSTPKRFGARPPDIGEEE